MCRSTAVGRGWLAGKFVLIKIAASFDYLFELLPCPVEPNLGAARCDAKGFSDFVVIQLSKKAQSEDFSILSG